MKRKLGFLVLTFIIFLSLYSAKGYTQCSICSRTTQQMGEKPGKAFNAGIIYLAFTPLAIGCILGYRWWKHNR
jgi:amino acid transporter